MPSDISCIFLWPRSLDLARLEDPHWIRAWLAMPTCVKRYQGAENSSTTGLSRLYLETITLAAGTMGTSMPSFFFSWHVSDLDLSLCYHQDDDFFWSGSAAAATR